MSQSSHLVIGMGEIGSAVFGILSSHYFVVNRDIEDTAGLADFDILHIAFPYSKNFVRQVKKYMKMYEPKMVIVYSTVPVGTCEKIAVNIVHSPVEGRHPMLEESIKFGTRWLGCSDYDVLQDAVDIWLKVVGTVRTLASSKWTEFLKLRSTAKYGINIVWTDYEKKVSDKLKMNFDVLKLFDNDYNDLYRKLGEYDYQRYILDPPNGEIGGHCIVPNADLLDAQYPHDMLKMIKGMRKKDVL